MKNILYLIFCLTPIVLLAQGTQLLRQPTLHNNEVAFIHANDLWKASTTGGTAQRLTSHIGAESSPHFSPDGSMIAFSGQYDGNTDVYVIPSQGGTPQRLTYHPEADVVQGWTPDGKILFQSGRERKPTQLTKFFTIGINDTFPESMALTRAAYGEISTDGKYVAYTPITSWDAEWRNYRGGQAMPVWIVNLKTNELQTTSQPTKERHLDPVWLNGIVYHLSERDYTSNIWSYNPATKEEKQITFHKKFDVKSLDADDNQLVYEHGGYLKLINPITGATKQLDIQVNADLNEGREHWEDVKGNQLSNAQVSPTGKRVVFEHRGDIFTIPKEKGTWRNLTKSSGVADRAPVWSPLGNQIAWFSDKSGEYELVIANQNGNVEKTITIPDPTFYFKPQWSPDGKRIAYTDTHYNIWVTEIASAKSNIVDTDSYAHPSRTMNPVWSPDSKWIAYSKQQKSHFKAIYAHNIETNKTIQITDPLADAISPVWDVNGEYLYVLASTDYGLSSGWLDMSSYDPSITRSLYTVVLAANGKAPHLPESDEEEKEAEKKETKKKEDVNVVIDEKNLHERILPMDLPAKDYTALASSTENEVFIAENKQGSPGLTVHKYDLKTQKATEFDTKVTEMTVSHDRKSILLRKGASWYLSKMSGKPDSQKDKLKTDLKILVDPSKEYEQIFKEGWRFMRDFLYVDNIHGAPWDTVYEWYSPWIKHAKHRSDLNYIVDIMSGEVAIGHSYVSGGDYPDSDYRVSTGLLGVDLEVHNDHYRIKKIYKGENWNPEYDSPLGLSGINVQKDDYLLAINGTPLDASMNPFELLEQTANRNTTITVSKNTNDSDGRDYLVTPISSERGLRYADWLESNRRKVDELSNGQLAYVYVPNTSQGGFTSFNRYLFSQQDKKGVIIDERNNGGGSAADYMIDILSRKPFGYFNSKANDRRPWTTPMAGIFGPKVMIINERAGSGGDLLPYMFKQANLGPLVGTRTWGGLVGTWDTPRFIDGGRMVAPRGGFFDLQGEWAVEGEGVAPDIEVIQTPQLTMQGQDPQLEKAVKEALELLKTQEFRFKKEPSPPVRSKRPAGY